jgi:hypothetical protein
MDNRWIMNHYRASTTCNESVQKNRRREEPEYDDAEEPDPDDVA